MDQHMFSAGFRGVGLLKVYLSEVKFVFPFLFWVRLHLSILRSKCKLS